MGPRAMRQRETLASRMDRVQPEELVGNALGTESKFFMKSVSGVNK